MKTTVKEYQEKIDKKFEAQRVIRRNEDLVRSAKNTIETDLERDELEKLVKELEESYFSKLPKVNVSYMIGSRLYYEEVVKIGKTYFCNGRKMTKSNGFKCIEEIETITEKMKEDMISDSYYY